MLGPGKYDHLCATVRREAEAECAIVIVIGGKKGSGFSCQVTPEVLALLPELLHDAARQIEAGRAAAAAEQRTKDE